MNEPQSPQNSWSKAVTPPVAPVVTAASSPPDPDSLRRFRIGVGATGGAFALLVALYFVWYAAKPPIVAPPRPPIPAQNGFDALKAATAKLSRKNDIADALARKPKKNWTIAQKRGMVAANTVAFAEARVALRLSYREENNMITASATYPHYAKLRELVRAQTLAGNVAWRENRRADAAHYYNDALTVGRRVPHQTALLGRLVGIACEAIARRPIWERLDTLDAATATALLAKLNALQAERLPYAVTMAEEKYTVVHLASGVYDNPQDLARDTSTGDSLTAEEQKMARTYRMYTRIVPRAVVLKSVGNYMDRIIAQCKKPYIQSKDDLPLPNEWLTRLVVPEMNRGRVKFVASEAGDALLRVALALRLHKLRTGTYPAALSELVAAKLLPALPDDPFALPGTPLVYKRLPGGKYLLYGIGSDSVDDGGKGATAREKNGVTRGIVPDSEGDMVVGFYWY